MRTFKITPRLLLGGLLAGAATTCGIALIATSGWLIVRAAQRPQILLLLTAIVAVRAFGLGRPLFRYLERLVSHDASLADLAQRRAATYSALVPLTPARLGKRGRAELLTGVVDDLTDVVEASVRVTVPVIGVILAGAAAALTAAAFDLRILWVMIGLLGGGAAISVLGWLLERRSQDRLLAARAESTRVSQLVTDQLSELRAIGATDDAQEWLRQSHIVSRQASLVQSWGRAVVAAGLLALTGVATALTAWVVWGSSHPTPIKGLLVLLPLATGDALGVLTDATSAAARAQASAHRIATLLDQSPAVAAELPVDAAKPTAPAAETLAPRMESAARVELDHLRAGWTPERVDLECNLAFTPGEHVAITGPNGCGKSTLLAVIARHLDPRSGAYRRDGADACKQDLAQVRSGIALVDDEPHIFSSTLRENLRLAAPTASDELLLDALQSAGLGSWVKQRANGLDAHLGRGGGGVSGGERARLGIARALLSQRPLLLLDEPTSHLDHPTATAVMADMLRHSQERTVVLVTHETWESPLLGSRSPDRPPEIDRFIDLAPRANTSDALPDPPTKER